MGQMVPSLPMKNPRGPHIFWAVIQSSAVFRGGESTAGWSVPYKNLGRFPPKKSNDAFYTRVHSHGKKLSHSALTAGDEQWMDLQDRLNVSPVPRFYIDQLSSPGHDEGMGYRQKLDTDRRRWLCVSPVTVWDLGLVTSQTTYHQ
jgi:hypothetical protein